MEMFDYVPKTKDILKREVISIGSSKSKSNKKPAPKPKFKPPFISPINLKNLNTNKADKVH